MLAQLGYFKVGTAILEIWYKQKFPVSVEVKTLVLKNLCKYLQENHLF